MENKKEFDFLLIDLNNPDATNLDYSHNGFDGSNTQLLDRETYKKSDKIQSMFQNETGKFDEIAFNKAYDRALIKYQNMVMPEDAYPAIYSSLSSRAYSHEALTGEEPVIINPHQVTVMPAMNTFEQAQGFTALNELGPRTKTVSEIAQQQLIYNPKEDKFETYTPEDLGAKYSFKDVLILATYDTDGTHIDPFGNEQQHRAGDMILNEDGKPFYEWQQERSLTGKQVLQAGNVLTREDSWINKHLDFIDNDGLQRSAPKVISHEALRTIPYYIPYVNVAWFAKDLVNIVPSILGIGWGFFGSEPDWINAIKGRTDKHSLGGVSEAAQQNFFHWENFMSLGADVLAQLKGQNMIFKGFQNAKMKRHAKKAEKLVRTKIDDLGEIVEESISSFGGKQLSTPIKGLRVKGQFVPMSKEQLAQAIHNAEIATSNAAIYSKGGERAAKSYMALMSGAETYWDSKEAGWSPEMAALIGLSSIAMYRGVLELPLANWMFPHSGIEKMAVRKTINDVIKEAGLRAEGIAVQKTGSALVASKFMNKVFNRSKLAYLKNGKAYKLLSQKATQSGTAQKAFDALEEPAANTLRTFFSGAGLKTFFSSAGKEAMEETYEQLGQDFIYDAFTTIGKMVDKDLDVTNLSSFRMGNAFETYIMNALGGAIGGGIGGVTGVRNLANIQRNNGNASQGLVAALANGQKDALLSELKKIHSTNIGDMGGFGSNVLSAEINQNLTTDDLVVYRPISESETKLSQNDLIYNALVDHINSIDAILNREQLRLSDDQIIEKTLERDNLFGSLYQLAEDSQLFSSLLSDWNRLSTQIVQKTLDIKNNKEKLTDAQLRNAEEDVTDINLKLKADEAELTALRQERKDWVENGSRSVDYSGLLMYTLMPNIRGVKSLGENEFTPVNLHEFAKHKYGIADFDYLNNPEKEFIAKEFSKFITEGGYNTLRMEYKQFKEDNEKWSPEIEKILHSNNFLEASKIKENFLKAALQNTQDILSINEAFGSKIAETLRKGGLSTSTIWSILNMVESTEGIEEKTKEDLYLNLLQIYNSNITPENGYVTSDVYSLGKALRNKVSEFLIPDTYLSDNLSMATITEKHGPLQTPTKLGVLYRSLLHKTLLSGDQNTRKALEETINFSNEFLTKPSNSTQEPTNADNYRTFVSKILNHPALSFGNITEKTGNEVQQYGKLFTELFLDNKNISLDADQRKETLKAFFHSPFIMLNGLANMIQHSDIEADGTLGNKFNTLNAVFDMNHEGVENFDSATYRFNFENNLNSITAQQITDLPLNDLLNHYSGLVDNFLNEVYDLANPAENVSNYTSLLNLLKHTTSNKNHVIPTSPETVLPKINTIIKDVFGGLIEENGQMDFKYYFNSKEEIDTLKEEFNIDGNLFKLDQRILDYVGTRDNLNGIVREIDASEKLQITDFISAILENLHITGDSLTKKNVKKIFDEVFEAYETGESLEDFVVEGAQKSDMQEALRALTLFTRLIDAGIQYDLGNNKFIGFNANLNEIDSKVSEQFRMPKKLGEYKTLPALYLKEAISDVTSQLAHLLNLHTFNYNNILNFAPKTNLALNISTLDALSKFIYNVGDESLDEQLAELQEDIDDILARDVENDYKNTEYIAKSTELIYKLNNYIRNYFVTNPDFILSDNGGLDHKTIVEKIIDIASSQTDNQLKAQALTEIYKQQSTSVSIEPQKLTAYDVTQLVIKAIALPFSETKKLYSYISQVDSVYPLSEQLAIIEQLVAFMSPEGNALYKAYVDHLFKLPMIDDSNNPDQKQSFEETKATNFKNLFIVDSNPGSGKTQAILRHAVQYYLENMADVNSKVALTGGVDSHINRLKAIFEEYPEGFKARVKSDQNLEVLRAVYFAENAPVEALKRESDGHIYKFNSKNSILNSKKPSSSNFKDLFGQNDPFEGQDVLFIDEGTYLSNEHLAMLDHYSDLTGKEIVVFMDSRQPGHQFGLSLQSLYGMPMNKSRRLDSNFRSGSKAKRFNVTGLNFLAGQIINDLQGLPLNEQGMHRAEQYNQQVSNFGLNFSSETLQGDKLLENTTENVEALKAYINDLSKRDLIQNHSFALVTDDINSIDSEFLKGIKDQLEIGGASVVDVISSESIQGSEYDYVFGHVELEANVTKTLSLLENLKTLNMLFTRGKKATILLNDGSLKFKEVDFKNDTIFNLFENLGAEAKRLFDITSDVVSALDISESGKLEKTEVETPTDLVISEETKMDEKPIEEEIRTIQIEDEQINTTPKTEQDNQSEVKPVWQLHSSSVYLGVPDSILNSDITGENRRYINNKKFQSEISTYLSKQEKGTYFDLMAFLRMHKNAQGENSPIKIFLNDQTGYDFVDILHTEHYLTIYKPFISEIVSRSLQEDASNNLNDILRQLGEKYGYVNPGATNPFSNAEFYIQTGGEQNNGTLEKITKNANSSAATEYNNSLGIKFNYKHLDGITDTFFVSLYKFNHKNVASTKFTKNQSDFDQVWNDLFARNSNSTQRVPLSLEALRTLISQRSDSVYVENFNVVSDKSADAAGRALIGNRPRPVTQIHRDKLLITSKYLKNNAQKPLAQKLQRGSDQSFLDRQFIVGLHYNFEHTQEFEKMDAFDLFRAYEQGDPRIDVIIYDRKGYESKEVLDIYKKKIEFLSKSISKNIFEKPSDLWGKNPLSGEDLKTIPSFMNLDIISEFVSYLAQLSLNTNPAIIKEDQQNFIKNYLFGLLGIGNQYQFLTQHLLATHIKAELPTISNEKQLLESIHGFLTNQDAVNDYKEIYKQFTGPRLLTQAIFAYAQTVKNPDVESFKTMFLDVLQRFFDSDFENIKQYKDNLHVIPHFIGATSIDNMVFRTAIDNSHLLLHGKPTSGTLWMNVDELKNFAANPNAYYNKPTVKTTSSRLFEGVTYVDTDENLKKENSFITNYLSKDAVDKKTFQVLSFPTGQYVVTANDGSTIEAADLGVIETKIQDSNSDMNVSKSYMIYEYDTLKIDNDGKVSINAISLDPKISDDGDVLSELETVFNEINPSINNNLSDSHIILDKDSESVIFKSSLPGEPSVEIKDAERLQEMFAFFNSEEAGMNNRKLADGYLQKDSVFNLLLGEAPTFLNAYLGFRNFVLALYDIKSQKFPIEQVKLRTQLSDPTTAVDIDLSQNVREKIEGFLNFLEEVKC